MEKCSCKKKSIPNELNPNPFLDGIYGYDMLGSVSFDGNTVIMTKGSEISFPIQKNRKIISLFNGSMPVGTFEYVAQLENGSEQRVEIMNSDFYTFSNFDYNCVRLKVKCTVDGSIVINRLSVVPYDSVDIIKVIKNIKTQSTAEPYVPEYLFDGNDNTQWRSKLYIDNKPNSIWVSIELPYPVIWVSGFLVKGDQLGINDPHEIRFFLDNVEIYRNTTSFGNDNRWYFDFGKNFYYGEKLQLNIYSTKSDKTFEVWLNRWHMNIYNPITKTTSYFYDS